MYAEGGFRALRFQALGFRACLQCEPVGGQQADGDPDDGGQLRDRVPQLSLGQLRGEGGMGGGFGVDVRVAGGSSETASLSSALGSCEGRGNGGRFWS